MRKVLQGIKSKGMCKSIIILEQKSKGRLIIFCTFHANKIVSKFTKAENEPHYKLQRQLDALVD